MCIALLKGKMPGIAAKCYEWKELPVIHVLRKKVLFSRRFSLEKQLCVYLPRVCVLKVARISSDPARIVHSSSSRNS